MRSSSIVFICLTALVLTSCGRSSKVNKTYSRIFSEVKYSEASLSPEDLDNFFTIYPADTAITRQVFEFYDDREYQMAWFVSGNLTSAAITFYDNMMEDVIESEHVKLFAGLIKGWETAQNNRKFSKDTIAIKQLELLLTTAYFRYARIEFERKIKKNLNSLEWYIPQRKKNYVALLDTLVSEGVYEEHMMVNRYYVLLKNYLKTYRKIEQNGGWPRINNSILKIQEGDTSEQVARLKKLLMLTGDYSGDDTSQVMNQHVRKAVKSFQERIGHDTTGTIDAETLAEMNTPVKERIRQIMINMERLRWFNAPDSTMDFLVVNIPAYKLLVFEKGVLSWDMNVVVGTTANRTTIFKGMLSQIVFNPYWNVPESILWNEMLDHLHRNPNGYTHHQNLEVLRDGKIVPASSVNWNDPDEVSSVRIRQRPGDQNSLGRIKFLFPNSFSIYLHDTPAKHLFVKNDRTFSHGCIRLQDARKLASYLLERDGSNDAMRIDNLLSKQKEISVRLKKPLPVFIVYFTSWVDENFKLHFRHDIYDNDKLLEKEMFDYPIL